VKILTEWSQNSIRYGLNRLHIVYFFILGFLSSISEVIGLSVFIPIFQFIGNDDPLTGQESKQFLHHMLSIYNDIGVSPSLEILLITAFTLFVTSKTIIFITKIYHISKYNDLLMSLRKKIFLKYINTTAEYKDMVSAGSIVNIITTESMSAINAVILPIKFMISVISIIISLFVLLFISYQMTITIIIMTLLFFMVPMRWINAVSNISHKITRKNSELASFIVNRINAEKLLKFSNTEKFENNKFSKIAKKHKFYLKSIQILKTRSDYILEPLLLGSGLFLIYLSNNYYSLDIEFTILFLLILIRMIPLVKELMGQLQALNRMIGPTQSVNNILDNMKENYEVDNGTMILENFSNEILFNSVEYTFSCSKGSNTLNGINFSISKGNMVAIVGPSGSGKSTLIDLITRIRLPSHGDIYIDGISIHDYKLSSLRRVISFAPQEPSFFSSTIFEHINYGVENISKENTIKSAALSGAKPFIDNMDKGYDTFIGEDSVRLSGGQKKRLDLARALNRSPKILILDEPEGNLDLETSSRLYETLSEINKKTGLTIVVVTHEYRFIQEFDKIIVINDGTVESVGRHSELLEIEGWYKRINEAHGKQYN